jgi:RND superfamily putative drug exporter
MGAHAPAVRHGLAASGGVITSAGLVLAVTFAALLTAPFVAFIQIGVTVAVGVILDIRLARSVLVPALALDTGRWFWWPSRLARHPRRGTAPRAAAGTQAADRGRLKRTHVPRMNRRRSRSTSTTTRSPTASRASGSSSAGA